MFNRIFIVLFFISLSFSCSTQLEIIEEEDTPIVCNNSDLEIDKGNKIAIPEREIPWTGTYNENSVTISFTEKISIDDEIETHFFIFDKVDDCLKFNRGFKYYDAKLVDISAVTEVDLFTFRLQEWIVDTTFKGEIVYKDPHNKKVRTFKFWVDLSPEPIIEIPESYAFFADCFGDKLPIDIDLNKDGKNDFILGYSEYRNIGNTPKFTEYTLKLLSTDEDINLILSPKRNNSPYFVVFEPPFSSENTRDYYNGVKNELDVFYEYDAPYQNYNFFLNNNLTYSKVLENNIDDYFLVRMTLADKNYFGWIKFKLNINFCSVEVVETYLHSIENEHISVK